MCAVATAAVAMISAAGALGSAGLRPMSAVKARHASACPTVLVIGSRGSGEHAGLGKPVGEFVTDLQADMNGATVASSANSYPAVSVSFSQLAKELVREPLRLSTSYTKSVAAGRTALQAVIAKEIAACPTTKLVLAGYSQGAQVTGDVYTGIASASSQGATFAAIAAVVLFADPDYNHLDRSDTVTSYQQTTQAGLKNDGILVHSPVTRPRAFPSDTRGRVLSYCVPTDPVCQGVGQLIHGFGAHSVYGKPGAPQPADAARYVAAHIPAQTDVAKLAGSTIVLSGPTTPWPNTYNDCPPPPVASFGLYAHNDPLPGSNPTPGFQIGGTLRGGWKVADESGPSQRPANTDTNIYFENGEAASFDTQVSLLSPQGTLFWLALATSSECPAPLPLESTPIGNASATEVDFGSPIAGSGAFGVDEWQAHTTADVSFSLTATTFTETILIPAEAAFSSGGSLLPWDESG